MKTIIKLTGLAAFGVAAFTVGRVYEVGRIIYKGVKFISSLPAPNVSNENESIAKDSETPKKVTITLDKEDYERLSAAFKKAEEVNEAEH